MSSQYVVRVFTMPNMVTIGAPRHESGSLVGTYATERDARKAAARILRRDTLRGLPMWWDDFHGRTVYAPKNGDAFVTIRDINEG